MRITGGAARGIPLRVPAGDEVRPATDALRQAVFSSLGVRVGGCRFLDLFAGSGAYGLEALSRGAAGGTFIEKNGRAADCLRRNVVAVRKSIAADRTGPGIGEPSPPVAGLRAPYPDVVVWESDALQGAWPETAPDLVFVDPPYEAIAEVAPPLFGRLLREYPASGDQLVIFEAPGEAEISPAGWTCRKRLGKGFRQPSALLFIRA